MKPHYKKARDARIAKCSLEGKDSIKTAQELKRLGWTIGARQVRRIRNKDEVKALINVGVEHNIAGIAEACIRHDDLLRSGNEKIALAAVALRYEVGGIKATHTPHPVIQAVFNIQQAIILSPIVHELMDKHLDDVIEGEIIEDNG